MLWNRDSLVVTPWNRDPLVVTPWNRDPLVVTPWIHRDPLVVSAHGSQNSHQMREVGAGGGDENLPR